MAEVGEANDVEMNSIYAMTGHRLGRNLEAHCTNRRLTHSGEQGVNLCGFWGGEATDHGHITYAALCSRTEPALEAKLAQQRGQDVDHGSLSVRSGHAKDSGIYFLGAINPGCNVAERFTNLWHNNNGDAAVLSNL